MHVVEVQVASEAHLAERRHVLVKLIEFVVLLEERFDAGPARLQGAGRAEQTDGARQHPHAGDAECREGDQGRAAPAGRREQHYRRSGKDKHEDDLEHVLRKFAEEAELALGIH